MRSLLLAQSARLADFAPNVLYVLLIARVLGPTAYGQYAVGFSAAFLISAMAPPSLSDLFGKHLAPGSGASHSVLWLAIRWRSVSAILGLCVLLLVSRLSGQDSPAELGALAAVFFSLEAINFAQAAATGFMAFGVLLRWRALGRGLTLVVALALVFIGAMTPVTAFLALAIGNVTTAIGTLRAIWPSRMSEPDREVVTISSVWRFGVMTSTVALLTIALGTQKDVVLVGALTGSQAAVGQYAAAAMLATQLQLLLTGGWLPASLPLLAACAGDTHAFGRRWSELATLWALTVGAPFVALAFAAPWVTEFLLGVQYVDAAAPLAVFAIGYALTAFLGGGTNYLALYAASRAGTVVATRTVAVVLNVSLALMLIPLLDAVGAALATSTSVVAVFAMELLALRRLAGVRLPLRAMAVIGAPIAIAALLAVGSVAFSGSWLVATLVFIGGIVSAASVVLAGDRSRSLMLQSLPHR